MAAARASSSPHTGLILLALLACALTVLSCRHTSSNDSHAGAAASGETAKPGSLPPLTLNDSTANLMLTWVDDQGDFHVVQQIAEVPAEHRERVRVVIMGQEVGTGQQVYVADLRQKSATGTYAVSSIARAQWDDVGASRRKERLDALTPKAQAAASANNPPLAPGAKLHATIYGASWCKPCHQAQDFLKSLGVEVTKKDIEESPAAQAEMRQKLIAAHRSGSSIPVIDFMGNIMVGFNADALRHLVEQARGTAPSADQTL